MSNVVLNIHRKYLWHKISDELMLASTYTRNIHTTYSIIFMLPGIGFHNETCKKIMECLISFSSY